MRSAANRGGAAARPVGIENYYATPAIVQSQITVGDVTSADAIGLLGPELIVCPGIGQSYDTVAELFQVHVVIRGVFPLQDFDARKILYLWEERTLTDHRHHSNDMYTGAAIAYHVVARHLIGITEDKNSIRGVISDFIPTDRIFVAEHD